eukprot:gb/GECG01013093.1/.p1 GENE.gb/GECG01013093.1/~~gb/GECG01013093.1/.p1  ORF type:complete len:183 (+),score=11.88 gb/GECG01013093.1/:1-549(+)
MLIVGCCSNAYRYFTQQELAELDHTYTLTIVNKARRVFHEFLEKLSQNGEIFRWCEADLKWALTIVESRAFTISKPSNTSHLLHEKPFLAPVADFLNHNPSAEVGWSIGNKQEASDVFQVLSLNTYNRAGEEVFNHYQVSTHCGAFQPLWDVFIFPHRISGTKNCLHTLGLLCRRIPITRYG